MKLISSLSRGTLAAFLVTGLAISAQGQGKSNEKKPDKAVKTVVTPAVKNDKVVKTTVKANEKSQKSAVKATKHVTSARAVIVTREVLVANGYQIVRVTPSGTSQIIYYRRGNMGRGRGLGPVERIIVVPAGEIVRFQAVPEPLLATILRRLGL